MSFYHIPKTGGTTIERLFGDQLEHCHIDNDSDFNSQIYNKLNTSKNIYIMFRNPLSHYISTFYFYNRYSSLKSRIDDEYTFKNYLNSSNTYNQQIQFLTRYQIIDKDDINEDDYDKVIEFINKPNVYTGTLDNIDTFIDLICTVENIDKKTLNEFKISRSNLSSLSEYMFPDDILDQIKKYNPLDWKLYEYITVKSSDKTVFKREIKPYPLSFPLAVFLQNYDFIDLNYKKLEMCMMSSCLSKNEYINQWYNKFKELFPIFDVGNIDKDKPLKTICKVVQKIGNISNDLYYLECTIPNVKYKRYPNDKFM